MENFKNYELESSEMILGGDLQNTYVGRNGDLYDTETGRYIFFEE